MMNESNVDGMKYSAVS